MVKFDNLKSFNKCIPFLFINTILFNLSPNNKKKYIGEIYIENLI